MIDYRVSIDYHAIHQGIYVARAGEQLQDPVGPMVVLMPATWFVLIWVLLPRDTAS